MNAVRQARIDRAVSRSLPLRAVVWLIHLVLPLLFLWLLIAQPRFDVRWEDHPAHFWLVLAAAVVNVGLAVRMNIEARKREDARLFLVALGFMSSAGFLALHAVATPGVVIPSANTGFVIATPVGLLLAALFAAASAVEIGPAGSARILRWQGPLRGAVPLILVGWGVLSLAKTPFLNKPLTAQDARGPLATLAIVGAALYAVAAYRYWQLHRRRPAVMLISVTTAFVLLAEAMVAIVFAPSWQTSWWLWHLLMTFAFGFVAYSAYSQYDREGDATGLFTSISLEQTVRRIRAEYGEALEGLVNAMTLRADGGTAPADPDDIARLADAVGGRFGLTPGQSHILAEAAKALATEREQIERLNAMAAIGREAKVGDDEDDLVERFTRLAETAFGVGSVAIVLGTRPAPPWAGEPGAVTAPLLVKGSPAGSLAVRVGGATPDERDTAMVSSLASQIGAALENVRLYRQIDVLFRQYIPSDVVTTLLADPDQAALGGAVVEATILFADLRGFTSYSERHAPEDVVALLNEYFGAAVPAILAEGGTVMKFVGDAIMAVFNIPSRQADHAARAGRAALAMQAAIRPLAAAAEGRPVFRVGINTGPVLVGNIGSAEFKDYTVIGDTVNLAARLESNAEPGHVLVSRASFEAMGPGAVADFVGVLTVKGKEETVDAFTLQLV